MRFVQVQPCFKEDGNVMRCGTPEALYFGVYLGKPGDYDWIADFVSRDDALNHARMLCKRHGAQLDDLT